MGELSKVAIVVKYNDLTSGLYKDGKPILASYDRTFVEDITGSFPLFEDLGGIQIVTSDGLAYTGGMAHTIDSYATRQRLWLFQPQDTNTGAVTINIDGVGVKSIKKATTSGLTDLVAGELPQYMPVLCYYDQLNSLFVISGSTASGGDESSSTMTIASASVLTGNSVPVDLIAAPGAGKVNIPMYFILSINYGTIPYDTNVELAFRYADGTQLVVDSDFLTATGDKVRIITVTTADGVINSKLQLIVNTGNPLSGDSPIKVVTKYKTITI